MECVTDNWSTPKEPLSSTSNCCVSGVAWSTDREEAKQAKLSFPPAEKTALSATLQQERRVKLLAKSRRQSSKRPTHRTTRLLDHRRNSTKRASRSCQTNLESISSRRLSKSDPCHTTKRRSQTLSCSSSRLSKLSWHNKHPLLLVDEALGVQEKPRAARSQSGQ